MLARLLGAFLADVAWFANTLSMLHMVNTPSAVCQGSCCASAVHVFFGSAKCLFAWVAFGHVVGTRYDTSGTWLRKLAYYGQGARC